MTSSCALLASGHVANSIWVVQPYGLLNPPQRAPYRSRLMHVRAAVSLITIANRIVARVAAT